MSIPQTILNYESQSNERRSRPREALKWVVLVFFGQDNWGKLVDLSENGMCFEFSQPPSERERINFRFEPTSDFPAMLGGEIISESFRATGDIRWTRDFERTAGVQFVSLPEESREQIRKWLSFEASANGAPTSNKTEQEAQIPLPELLESMPAPLETPPTMYEEELQLGVEGNDYGAELFAHPTSQLMQRILKAFTFISNQMTNRPQVTGIAVALVAAVLIGGFVGILARLPHRVSAVEPTSNSTVGKSESTASLSTAATGSPRPFLVEVVDASHRRWFLWFADDNFKNAPTKSTDTTTAPSSTASSRSASRSKQPAVSAKSAAPSKFTVIAPHLSRAVANNLPLNSPSVAVPMVREELHAPWEAPLAHILTSQAMPDLAAISAAPVGGKVQEARLVKSVAPVYPSAAKLARVSGDVTMDAVIDSSGNVTDVRVILGPPLLQDAAIDALREWKYEPARLDGQPTSTHLRVTLKFRLSAL